MTTAPEQNRAHAQMNVIDTARLRIRPFVERDLADVARLLDDCFGPAPLEERRAWLEWSVRNYAALAKLCQPPYGDYAIVSRNGGEIVGSVGLVPSYGPFAQLPILRDADAHADRAEGLSRPEMGLFWAIAPAQRRRGYASEAAKAMAAYAFDALRAHRLIATTEYENLASIGVMRKIGMTIDTNARPTPAWFQVVGVLLHPTVTSVLH